MRQHERSSFDQFDDNRCPLSMSDPKSNKSISTMSQRPSYRCRSSSSVQTRRREQKMSSTNEQLGQEDYTSIPFPVPSALTTEWLLSKAPIVLAHHLVYVRGLWPMPVPNLILQQEKDDVRSMKIQGRSVFSDSGSKKRRRMIQEPNRKSSPSLLRKQKHAINQITQLCDEWNSALVSCRGTTATSDHDNLPMYLLISLGSSYGQSRELYLLDFSSLLETDACVGKHGEATTSTTHTAPISHDKEQKMQTTLARKLISALMNYHSDGIITDSLPHRSSPSFRLRFTAGFGCARHSTAKSTTNFLPASCPSSQDGTTWNSPSFVSATKTMFSWISRTRFPFRQHESSSRRPSSNKQSLIAIRFQRSLQQDTTNPLEKDSVSDLQQLSWMSLSTCVKGFRL